jgi:hypothetical protein
VQLPILQHLDAAREPAGIHFAAFVQARQIRGRDAKRWRCADFGNAKTREEQDGRADQGKDHNSNEIKGIAHRRARYGKSRPGALLRDHVQHAPTPLLQRVSGQAASRCVCAYCGVNPLCFGFRERENPAISFGA